METGRRPPSAGEKLAIAAIVVILLGLALCVVRPFRSPTAAYLTSMRDVIKIAKIDNGEFPQTEEHLKELITFRLGYTPALPHGKNAGSTEIHFVEGKPEVDETIPAGWVYSKTTGDIIPNTTILDRDGRHIKRGKTVF